MNQSKSWLKILIPAVVVVFLWSAYKPHDYFTWFLEVAPILLGLIILIPTYRRFPLTPFCYLLIGIHAAVLMIGSKYTYAEVPLFNWLRDIFHWSRNHYDRVGHFSQGFFPAIYAREVLLRLSPLQRGKWLHFIVVCICLAFSAFYEFIEWWVALATGEAADAFLGSQGDVWDTQWDMFLAFVGANVALIALGKIHDRFLSRL